MPVPALTTSWYHLMKQKNRFILNLFYLLQLHLYFLKMIFVLILPFFLLSGDLPIIGCMITADPRVIMFAEFSMIC